MKPVDWMLSALIRGYQVLLSPVLPPACRFHPTCSQYSLEAVGRFGAVRGGWLALRRIGRCHPWGDNGFDPVPETKVGGNTVPRDRAEAPWPPATDRAGGGAGHG